MEYAYTRPLSLRAGGAAFPVFSDAHCFAMTDHMPPLDAEAAARGEKILAIATVPMPADCNMNGTVFGGWLMGQIDIAGAMVAISVARSQLATVAVHSMTFLAPILPGDRVTFYAQLTRIGKTSVTVAVEAYAEHAMRRPAPVKVSDASLTYVAIDSEGRPRDVKREAD